MDSSYNLNGLITRIKILLDDQSYDESTIIQALNDAYFETLGEAHYQFLEKIFSAATQKSDVLPLPKNFQSVALLTAKLDKEIWRLNYLDYQDFMSHTVDSGAKDFTYTIFGNQLFYSVPDIERKYEDEDEQKFYDLRLAYLAKPVAMTKSTDVPLIPAEFGELLVLGALARLERIRGNYDFAGIHDNKKDELITNMKLRYCPRNLNNANRGRLPIKVTLEH